VVGEEKKERPYPLRSLHEFLLELDREWDKFRTGSLVGASASLIVVIFLLIRFFTTPPRLRNIIDLVFMALVIAMLIYSIITQISQHNFFRKWERRIGLLIMLEQRLMEEKLGGEGKENLEEKENS